MKKKWAALQWRYYRDTLPCNYFQGSRADLSS